MNVRFLLDENISPRLKPAVLRLNPDIDLVRMGEPTTPSLGTLDPEVLKYLELSQRLLITNNRNSMPGHLEDHWAEGGQIWGLFWIRPGTPLGILAQELCLIWETSDAEEWINTLDWIPF